MHVVIVSLISNIGKMVPLFFYRDRKLTERLAVSIGMFTRGEVGAGVIFIAIGYNLGGNALIIAALSLVLNLILTGGFVLIVQRLAIWSYFPKTLKSCKSKIYTPLTSAATYAVCKRSTC